MSILTVENVSKVIDGRLIVDNVSFSQQAGEKIAIAGETGSGKSCLMKMIGGHLQASEGIIRFEGQQVFAPPDKLLPGHPGVMYLSQHFELRNNYFVHEMLDYANDLTEEESTTLYRVCQIEQLLHRKTNSGLSGGERQRIALAMQLATRPRLLLLDEPFSNLDIIHKQIIRQVVQDISNNFDCSIIMVSHDPLDILSWSDTVMIMKNGCLVQTGSPKEIYTQPVDEYVGGLFGNFNIIDLKQSINDGDAPVAERIFVRPETIMIHKPDEPVVHNIQLHGTIESMMYYGIYYLVNIKAGNKPLLAYTSRNDLSAGEPVTCSIASEATWKIPVKKTTWDM